MEKLSKPPLVKASLIIQYPANLQIIDNKSVFYEKIKKDFSQVYYPDIKRLPTYSGDIDFLSPQDGRVLGVNATGLKYEEYKYQKFDNFLNSFSKLLGVYSETYGIKNYSQFRLSYDNKFVLTSSVGKNFNDYFTIKVDLKSANIKEFLGGQGILIFKVDNGLFAIDVNPELNQLTNAVENFKMVFTFEYSEQMDLKRLLKEVERAHSIIEDVFVNALTPKYFDTLK